MIATLSRAVCLALALSCLATAAAAEWRRAETEHFVVYGDVSERTLRSYASRIETFDALLRTYYPIKVDHEIPKLEIFLAEGRRDMVLASPGISAGVAGYYSTNSGRIHAVVNTQAGTGDIVLFHEYAHHFMFQMNSNAYPSWFVEGFAEYYATAEFDGDTIRLGRVHPWRMGVLNLNINQWASMEDVLKWRLTASGRYPASLYYAQAWGMAHYFLSTPERTRMLGQYLSAVVRGADSVEAMTAATGRTPDQLQNDVRRYISGVMPILTPQIDLPRPTVAVSTLTGAESDLAWLDLRLDNTSVIVEPIDDDGRTNKSEAQKAKEAAERAEIRADLIRDAFATAARHPDDRSGLLATAKAHRLSGAPDRALTTLSPLLSDSSTDAEALRVAAYAMLDQVKTADAETAPELRRRASGYLARAMDNDPLDYRIYLGLNQTRRGQARYPTDNDISTLEVAVALAPQSFDARLRLGEAYLDRQLNREAELVLTPVSNSPHRSAYTRRARDLINRARAAQGKAAETFDAPATEDEGAAPAESEGAPAA